MYSCTSAHTHKFACAHTHQGHRADLFACEVARANAALNRRERALFLLSHLFACEVARANAHLGYSQPIYQSTKGLWPHFKRAASQSILWGTWEREGSRGSLMPGPRS